MSTRLTMPEVLRPHWETHPRIQALVTTRAGGVSQGSYQSLNLGAHVGDNPRAVAENRARLEAMSAPCVFVNQVHGGNVVEVHSRERSTGLAADALWTRQTGLAIGILTADCFPLLLADRRGRLVALAHCGWRPLRERLIARLLEALPVDACELVAWLGPGISQSHYAVGEDFVHAMADLYADGLMDGVIRRHAGRMYADLARLIRNSLAQSGVHLAAGEPCCTFEDDRFFSHRRDGPNTGRFASVIWLSAGDLVAYV